MNYFFPGLWAFVALLYLVVLSGPKQPPSEGYRVPVYYGSPCPPGLGAPLSYNERFSPACVGPAPDYNNDNEPLRGAPAKGCPVALAAVEAHGVGE